MAVAANKRSIMTLFSGADDLYSHQVRIVLAEKGVTVDVLQALGGRKKTMEEPIKRRPQSKAKTNKSAPDSKESLAGRTAPIQPPNMPMYQSYLYGDNAFRI